jgi:hypothetical protein
MKGENKMEINCRTYPPAHRVTETLLDAVQSFAEHHNLSYHCVVGEDYVKLNGYVFNPEGALTYIFGFQDGIRWEGDTILDTVLHKRKYNKKGAKNA